MVVHIWEWQLSSGSALGPAQHCIFFSHYDGDDCELMQQEKEWVGVNCEGADVNSSLGAPEWRSPDHVRNCEGQPELG